MTVLTTGSANTELIHDDTVSIEVHVHRRLDRRIRNLQVIAHGHGLILRGHAPTYYAKQLAQHAVMEASPRRILANEIEVA
jgi:hypothetical protein